MIPLTLLASVLMLAVPPTPVITMDPDQLSAVTGQKLTLESRITAPAGSIAHLNVTSLDGVYVDLEDWTQDVTQPVPAESQAQLGWEFQAVNSGRFAVYVVVIPKSGQLTVSSPVHVTVAKRQSLDTRGALPVALAIPTLLGLAALGSRLRRVR
ncbi:hypothetical protein ACFTSF_11280 [Kribbella sp. NPDC056951]|uniref:hypothetical protein n=1 Tax=Kribbella sp. NPDC056951 TaxID=3345978 RepID=UPI00363C67CC